MSIPVGQPPARDLCVCGHSRAYHDNPDRLCSLCARCQGFEPAPELAPKVYPRNITQIATTFGREWPVLFALDDAGTVWRYDRGDRRYADGGWEQLPPLPLPERTP